MMVKRTLITSLVGLIAVSAWHSCYASDCSKIQDPSARLACFDKNAKSTTAKKTAATADPFAEAKAAMTKKLRDPESARYDGLFKIDTPKGPAVCGRVNSKNAMGGYVGARGFIYEPWIKRATLMFSGGTDPDYTMDAAGSYCTYCAYEPDGDQDMRTHCPNLVKPYR